jgi:hypothetical protein|tara:strand:+ start:9350 stop:9607 length:258 start_codon:yes stop_codon:yes gene_type:complete
VVQEEVNSIFQPSCVVPGENDVKALDGLFLSIDRLGLTILKLSVYNVLGLELIEDFRSKLCRAEVLTELSSAGKSQVMRFWDHTL